MKRVALAMGALGAIIFAATIIVVDLMARALERLPIFDETQEAGA